jgi:hypothetical protein
MAKTWGGDHCPRLSPAWMPAMSETVALAPSQVEAIAEEAFLFGLPLVYIALNFDAMTNVPKPEGMRAPAGQFAHVRSFPDAKSNPIVGMNVDTLYSFGNLDLADEPFVLSVPDMGNRWWIMQLIDGWNDVPDAPGARTVGGKGGDFALVGPNWQGSLPAGLTEIRSDTNLLMIGGRTFTAGEADVPNVHKVQDGYRLTPLSKWGSAYAPSPTVPVKPGVDATTPVPKLVFAMSPQAFFSKLVDLLVTNPARQADAPVLARMAELGIAPGAKFDFEAFDFKTQTAITAGVAAARQAILSGKPNMGEMINGWQVALDLGRYGTRYLYRAIWTYFAVGGNLVEDACYPMAIYDGRGELLTGANNYVLRFAKEEIPPAHAFWSLTMYDDEVYLVPNPLDRYSLGDRSEMTYGDDGSLTIYIQRTSPGPEKESNWLPAPDGAINLALRIYGPGPTVVDGSWRPPGVQKAT